MCKNSRKKCTEIANTIISLDYKQFNTPIHLLLSKLNYTLSGDNIKDFTSFIANFESDEKMDDVLVYCGKKGYFSQLETIVAQFIALLFIDDSYDDLLAKIQEYLTTEQREKLFATLLSKSAPSSGYDYSRNNTIYSILSKSQLNTSQLEHAALGNFVSSFGSYASYNTYLEFVSRCMGDIKEHLTQATVDKYISSVTSVFSSYRSACLKAIDRMTGRLSKESFALLYPLLTQSTQPTDLEITLRILKNNNALRDSGLNASYRDFLVKHIENANDPNALISTLCSTFHYFSNLSEFISISYKNKNVDYNTLLNALLQCFNNYDKLSKVASEMFQCLEHNESFDLICKIMDGITSYDIEDIVNELDDIMADTTSIGILINLIKLSVHYPSTSSAKLLLDAISLCFTHDNQPVKVVEAVRHINNFDKATLSKSKKEIADALYKGFNSTTSEDVKQAILSIVSSAKIKKQFQPLLGESELSYYKQWVQ